MRERILAIVESLRFQNLVLALIVINAVVLGAETLDGAAATFGAALPLIDRIVIYAFVVEIALRIYAHRGAYFRDGWNIFDFLVVAVSLLAATSGLAAIRAFRVLRVLRLVTVIPRMRTVVSALLGSIPGIASVGVVLVIIVYVFAVIAANLYGAAHPELFGDVFAAMYTLFQVMTLEDWPDVAAAVRETHAHSWIFFVVFLLIATFTMLNLFVAIVVRAVDADSEARQEELASQHRLLLSEISALRQELARIETRLR